MRKQSQAGRPALWGPRTPLSLRIPDHLLALLQKRAAEAGMSTNAYALLLMANAEGIDLKPKDEKDDTDRMTA